MGAIYKQRITRPLPERAEVRNQSRKATEKELRRDPQKSIVQETVATWRDRSGRKRTAVVVIASDGSQRVQVKSDTYYAKYRDANNLLRIVPTGCRDLQAARVKLAELMRNAEKVQAGLLTSADCRIIEHAAKPLEEHLQAYLNGLAVAGVSSRHLADLRRLSGRLIADCGFQSLRDIATEAVEGWLLSRSREGMGARTRNTYLQSLLGFCNWCIESGRLTENPLKRIKKADEALDRRRQRRALSEAELRRLLYVARWRPLAEHGRLAAPNGPNERPTDPASRRTWHLQPLAFDDLPAALERAAERLKENPSFAAELDRRGWERSLIYKVAVLTGLRRGEIESLTVAHLQLDAPTPFVRLRPADAKNRQAAEIPLRADLVDDLRAWLDAMRKQSGAPVRKLRRPADLPPAAPLFAVPKQLVKSLDRDLAAAGIAKVDERGRTVDIHALRHSFGTLLSTSGVAPRTAQQAMRHSEINLTMEVYTDPRLLDVAGAIEALPTLSISERPEFIANGATGTDDHPRSVTPNVAPAAVFESQNLAFRSNLGDFGGIPLKSKNPAKSKEITGFGEYPGRGSNPQPSASEAERSDIGTQEKQSFSCAGGNCYTNCYTNGICIADVAAKLRSMRTPEQLGLLVAELSKPPVVPSRCRRGRATPGG